MNKGQLFDSVGRTYVCITVGYFFFAAALREGFPSWVAIIFYFYTAFYTLLALNYFEPYVKTAETGAVA